MDRAEMVAWLRTVLTSDPVGTALRAGIADELERLGHVEAEHQGCTPSSGDFGGLPDLVKQWLLNREGKTFRDCGATAAVCKVLRDHERLLREHQGCALDLWNAKNKSRVHSEVADAWLAALNDAKDSADRYLRLFHEEVRQSLKLRDELERLRTEHQGCEENAASLVRERDELRSALSLMELERNGARIERNEAKAQLDRIEGFNREKQQGHGRAMSQVDFLKSELLSVDRKRTKALEERNEARAERDAAYKALDELREWLSEPQSTSCWETESVWSTAAKAELDALDPRKQGRRRPRRRSRR